MKKETKVLTKDRMFFVALLSREDIVSSGEEKVAPMNICHFVLVSVENVNHETAGPPHQAHEQDIKT